MTHADEAPLAEGQPESARAPDETKTPAEWAEVCGHTNPKTREGGRCSASDMKAWIFAAAKAHNGWGTTLAEDVQLTRAAYEAAVQSAMDLPIGERHGARKAAA